MSGFDSDLADLFEQYKDEVRDIVQELDGCLVDIEQEPSNSETIFSIFRHLHSLKGTSKMFNVDNIAHVAHKLEDLMSTIDKDNSILLKHTSVINLLFKGNDIFGDIISRLEDDINFTHLTPEHAQFVELVNDQVDAIQREDQGLLKHTKRLLADIEVIMPEMDSFIAEKISAAINPVKDTVKLLISSEADPSEVLYYYGEDEITEHIRAYEAGLAVLDSDDFKEEDVTNFFKQLEAMIDALFDIADEDLMEPLRELNDGLEMYSEKSLEVDAMIVEFFGLILDELKKHLKTDVGISGELPILEEKIESTAGKAKTGTTKTIRVDEAKIDIFLESVGKLITQSEILNHLQFAFKEAGIGSDMIRQFVTVNRTISSDIVSLQKSIMEVRQVEIDNVLKKFPRLVRDLSHEISKDVALTISGQDILVDKSLLEEVEQALIHLIRNSLDHGLETPDEREAAGKDKRGNITIDVTQEETSIIINIIDDGRGIALDKVGEKALARGLVTREQLRELDEDEITELIFSSGVTTKEEATDISGRGVGLDVVMSNVKKWGGEVSLDNRPGQGLTVSLRIPITNTLLTKEAILIRLADQSFCLPLDAVVEILTVSKDRMHAHKDQVVFEHRDKIISVVDIKDTLNINTREETDSRFQTVIVLRGKKRTGRALVADEIIGQQKIVIKDFDIDSFKRLPHFQGFSLLGDGSVLLVLDVEAIME